MRKVHQFLLRRMLFLAFFFWRGFLLGALCIWGLPALLLSLLCTRLGLHRCASCWTRPLGEVRWGHYLCNLWEVYLTTHKTAYSYFWFHECFVIWPLWPASCLLADDKSRGPQSIEVQRFGMMSVFSLCLDMMPCSWMGL